MNTRNMVFYGVISALVIIGAFTIGSTILYSQDASASGYWKHHNIPEITGSVIAGENYSENIDKVQIDFGDATAVAENAVTEGKAIKGNLGAIQGFVVYTFAVVDSDDNFHKVIVDAGDGLVLHVSEGKSIEDFGKYGHHGKWGEFKEMKMAFNALSDEDKETIMSHFKEMKQNYANLTEEEKSLKKTEFKQMWEEFSQLSVDEKIEYLKESANSIRQPN